MPKEKFSRAVTAIFGVFFVVLALLILVAAWESTPTGAAIASLVVGFLGAEAILSAVRDRASLLSRIGPLP